MTTGSLDGRARAAAPGATMPPTDIGDPAYFHKVVDCQWACPAHTPVPEYIRLIAAGRYTDAYIVNWKSNVFPGILGRTCDRPCEPACRRGPGRERAGGDLPPEAGGGRQQGRHFGWLPKPVSQKNGKRWRCIGAGPASLTVAPRPAAARLRGRAVRRGRPRRRHDRSQIPKVPSAGIGDRRGGRLHPRHGRELAAGRADRQS
jgi:hypothetical protein